MAIAFYGWAKAGVLHSWYSAMMLAEELLEKAHDNMCHVLSNNPYPLEDLDDKTRRTWNRLNEKYRGRWPDDRA